MTHKTYAAAVLVTLALAAYAVLQLDRAAFRIGQIAAHNEARSRTAKFQERWTGCYYDARSSVVRCREE